MSDCTRDWTGKCVLPAGHLGGCQHERMPNTEAERLCAALAAAERRAERAEREASDRYMMLQAATGAADTAKRERDDHRRAEASAWQQREEMAAERDTAESRASALAARVSALEGALNAARLTARPVIADDGVRASVAAGAWSALCALAPAALSAPAPDAAREDGAPRVDRLVSGGPRPTDEERAAQRRARESGEPPPPGFIEALRVASDIRNASPAPAPGDATARCLCRGRGHPDLAHHTPDHCGALAYVSGDKSMPACSVCWTPLLPAPAAGSPDTRTDLSEIERLAISGSSIPGDGLAFAGITPRPSPPGRPHDMDLVTLRCRACGASDLAVLGGGACVPSTASGPASPPSSVDAPRDNEGDAT